MTTLFEKAIADAKELKEAAQKNAEQMIIEKYSVELKEALEDILDEGEAEDEAEMEDEMAGAADLGVDTEQPDTDFAAQIPDAASAGEKLCPCPDDDEEIEINFDELMADYEASVPPEEMQPEDEETALVEALEGLDASEVESLLEEITFDVEPVSDGWLGSTPAQKKAAIEIEKTRDAIGELQKEHKELQALVEKHKKINQKLVETNKKNERKLVASQKVLIEMKQKMAKTNLQNAKLFYTSKTLQSTKLNTRQKSKIVESVNDAKSVEETKLVYEALKDTVGSTKNNAPESLLETVNKNRSLVLSSRKKEEINKASPMYDHWKKLAGINKP